MTAHRQGRAIGFTLLEVIVALALILALIGMMFGFAADLIAARQRLHEFSARQRAATTLIDRVEADLATCIVADAAAGAGVQGDARRLRILSRSVSIAEVGAAGGAAALGDLQVAEYRFDASRRLIEGRRGAATSQAAPEAAFSALGGTVHEASFRYHDGKQWRDEFDSLRERRLPRAVEVAVWFETPSDESTVAATGSNRSALGASDAEESDIIPTFDEESVARDPNRLGLNPSLPDRVRVILIPDSEPDDQTAAVPSISIDSEPSE